MLVVGGATNAAASSQPGEPLYGLKRVSEDVQVALTFDDVARMQRGHQDLLDVGAEGGAVDRAIEHGRRGQLRGTERRHYRVRLPMTAGRVIANPRPAQAAGIAA